MITCSMYGRGNSSSQPIRERTCWMNMYQTTFKGHAGASPLGGRKKGHGNQGKPPTSLVCGHLFSGKKTLAKMRSSCTLLQTFILYIIYILHGFGCSFVVSPFSLCMVSCKSKICMIIAYLLSSTQMFQ